MQGTTRQTVFRVHAWIGLNIGLLLYAVCLTGTLAVFSSELEWLTEPLLRAAPDTTAGAAPFSWQSLHDAIDRTYPQAAIAVLRGPNGDDSVAGGVIAFGPRDVRLVLVNPNDYSVVAQRSTFGLRSFLRILHKQFYIVPGIFGFHGLWIVGTLGLFLIVSAATGLLSIKRWRRTLVTLRAGRSKRLLFSDLHRLSGLWALPLTILFAGTGIWYLAENILISADMMTEEAGPTAAVLPAQDHTLPVRPLVDLDLAAQAAEAALPGLTISQLILPRRLDDPLTFLGQAQAILVRDRANHVEVDPHTGLVLNVRRAEDLDVFPRWVETADPLHFGTFGGLTTQIIWLFAGIALCASILTGLYGAWLRLEKEKKLPARPLFALLVIAPSVAVFLLAAAGAILFGGTQWARAHSDINGEVLARAESIGPWSVDVLRDMRDTGPLERISIRFKGGFPILGAAMLAITDKPDPSSPADEAAKSQIRQFSDRIWASVRHPKSGCADTCTLHLTLASMDGGEHVLSLPIQPKHMAGATYTVPHAARMAPGELAVIVLTVLLLALPFGGWAALQFRRREGSG